MDEEARSTRRDFLTGMFRRMAQPAGRALAALSDKDSTIVDPGPTPKLLRPPGAIPEDSFRLVCLRTGGCVAACPEQAIRIWESTHEEIRGTPYIDPDIKACTLCDSLACMEACYSGALQRMPREQIRMGVARVEQWRCARDRGQSCDECVQQCPVGGAAIGIDPWGRVEVLPGGCTGCGVCQQVCPEPVKAITVTPLSAMAW